LVHLKHHIKRDEQVAHLHIIVNETGQFTW